MAARILQKRRDALHGCVKFMFQPAEEGPGGALPMIRAGLLRSPSVDQAIALHLWNELPTGTIGVREGPVFAAVDEFTLALVGKGGHGATPHFTKDPIVAAAGVINALQTVVSRKVDPQRPAVVTIGRIEGGTKHNIIPDRVTLYGTVRSFQPAIRKLLRREIHRIVQGVAQAHGIKTEMHYAPLYPATVNDARVAEFVRGVASEIVGRKNVVRQDPTMGAEDMSYVLQRVPGCYLLIGSKNEKKGLIHPHHSPRFNFDEDALPVGIELVARTAERYLAG